MNFFLVALVSVVLATGVFNPEPKDIKENKQKEIILKETLEKKPAEEKVKSEQIAQAQAEAEAKAAAEAQKESKEIDSSNDSGTNYLRLALYIFGSILVISIGAYFYFRQRDNLSSRSVTRTPDSPRRDFRKEVVAEPQEQKPNERSKCHYLISRATLAGRWMSCLAAESRSFRPPWVMSFLAQQPMPSIVQSR